MRKIAVARQRYAGPELAAALEAIHAEHKAAERALQLKLTIEARQRRRAALTALRTQRKARAKTFQDAARQAQPPAPPRQRRHARKRPRKANPRPRR